MHSLIYLIEAIFAINLLVVVHELGHMLAGRAFGVHSRKFCIGIGPRLFGFRYRGTDFCVAPVPLGGFVQLEDGHDHLSDRTCMSCISPWKRIIVFFAGPFANLLFVVVLLWTVFFALGLSDSEPVIATVDPSSPAAEAGLRPGDRIVSVNGQKALCWTHAAVALGRSKGKPLQVILDRPAEVLRQAREGSGAGSAQVAVSLEKGDLVGAGPSQKQVRLRLGPLPAAKHALAQLVELSGILYRSFTGLATASVKPSELVGPVYLFHTSAKAAAESQVSLVYLLAVISACLFFFNLLPLPILDGGQIVLTVVESVLRRPLGPKSMKLLIHASLFWLLLLIASSTLNDVVRLLKG